MMSLTDRVRRLVAEQLRVDEGIVTDESHFVNDLGGDSLDAVEIIITIEEKFEVDIPDADADLMVTLGKAVEWLRVHGVSD